MRCSQPQIPTSMSDYFSMSKAKNPFSVTHDFALSYSQFSFSSQCLNANNLSNRLKDRLLFMLLLGIGQYFM
jgi:hypothetical protein